MTLPELLSDDEPEPAAVVNPDGASPFVLIGDHGGRRVPQALAQLGLPEAELGRHIGWDIGVTALGEALSARLDAVFVHQRYSRLVIDCNRAPDAADAMPEVSDGTVVPGNRDLSAAARARRVEAVHRPYHATIAHLLTTRHGAGRPALVALHSFTPVMKGFARPWHCGILHDGANEALGLELLKLLKSEGDLVVGDNQPYAMDGIDYTVPRHAFALRLPYAEIEVRQDPLADATGIAHWADRLARLLPQALDLVRARAT